MGMYINQTSKGMMGALGKAQALLEDGAVEIKTPNKWQEGMVCVVANGFFDAAAYIPDEDEMNYFITTPNDFRPRRWFIYNKAKEYAG